MEGIKTNEKADVKKIASLEKQISTKERYIDGFISSAEYRTEQEDYYADREKIEEDQEKDVRAFLIMNPGTPYPESEKKKFQERLSTLNKEREEMPLFKERRKLEREFEKVVTEYNELMGIKRQELRTAFENQVTDFTKKIETAIEKIFLEVDDLHEQYIKPLTDFGMTKQAALAELSTKNPTIRNTIENLEYNITELESYQTRLNELSKRGWKSGVDSLYSRFENKFKKYD